MSGFFGRGGEGEEEEEEEEEPGRKGGHIVRHRGYATLGVPAARAGPRVKRGCRGRLGRCRSLMCNTTSDTCAEEVPLRCECGESVIAVRVY